MVGVRTPAARLDVVGVGDRVSAGQQVAEVGNTGNTSEPHLHFQLMDAPHVTGAAGLPWRWRGVTELDEVDATRVTGERRDGALRRCAGERPGLRGRCGRVTAMSWTWG